MTRLGEKVGESAAAEVFAFGPGRVIKLYRLGTDPGVIDYEVKATTAAFASGAPAPEVLGTQIVDGRTGLILPRYHGRSLLEMIGDGKISAEDAGSTLARVHADLHGGRYRTNLRSFRVFVNAMSGQLAQCNVPANVIDRARAIAADLPESDTLCHGDLHFGNVLITPDGPRIIDWISAMRASHLVDIARQHLTLAVFTLPREYEIARHTAERSFIRTYAALTGTSDDDLRAAIAPYVTVMAVMRMTETGCSDNEREMLAEFVRSR